MDRARLSERLSHIVGLRCVVCEADYSLDDVEYNCPTCGDVGALDVVYTENSQQYSAVGPLTFWRQRDLLPLVGDPLAGLRALGGTPLIEYDALRTLAAKVDVVGLCIKNDGLNLTGSLKDRASAMVVNHAVQNLGKNVIATASTGNAAAALAGCCAAVDGAEAVIFVPASAPEAKIAQMLIFGAKVILVDADYDTAFDLCTAACTEFGWYNRSTGINPFTTEGKKTVSFEIAEQLNWQMPDVIVVSVGDGSIIGGVHKGCSEMYNRGWIDRMPRLIGVQAAGSDAMVYAWENNIAPADMKPHRADTLADSISSGLPRDRAKAMRAVRETDGVFMRVSDDEILNAIPTLAQGSGVFAEPAASAAFAAVQPAREAGYIQKNDRVLLLITGNGLKDVKSAMQTVTNQKPPNTAPTLDAIRERVANW
jgi:threonine synthase